MWPRHQVVATQRAGRSRCHLVLKQMVLCGVICCPRTHPHCPESAPRKTSVPVPLGEEDGDRLGFKDDSRDPRKVGEVRHSHVRLHLRADSWAEQPRTLICSCAAHVPPSNAKTWLWPQSQRCIPEFNFCGPVSALWPTQSVPDRRASPTVVYAISVRCRPPALCRSACAGDGAVIFDGPLFTLK